MVKVEPLEGAAERNNPGNFIKDGYNITVAHYARGKRSICVDMKHPRAVEVLRPLVEWADVRLLS